MWQVNLYKIQIQKATLAADALIDSIKRQESYKWANNPENLGELEACCQRETATEAAARAAAAATTRQQDKARSIASTTRENKANQ